MKNYKIKLTIIVTITTLILTGCGSKDTTNTTDTNNNTSVATPVEPTISTSDYIGMDNAENIAKLHAIEHLDDTNAEFINVDVTMDLSDESNVKYIVEFYVDDNKFNYEIHSKTGEIINFETNYVEEIDNDSIYISKEEAIAIAYADADVNADDVDFVNASIDFRDNLAIFDVEFYIGSNEFDYELDALTGKILAFDNDAELFDVSISEDIILGEAIGEESAVNIARTDANTENTSNLFVKLETSDTSNPYYLVEFLSNNTQFSYEIQSVTGEILFKSSETDENAINGVIVDQNDEESPYIGDGKAVVTAVNHAGSDPTSEITIELDIEGSKSRYHVGFFINNTEYQYEIDAINGKIMALNKETKNYNNGSTATSSSNDNMVIGDEAALDIALKYLGADSATFIKVDFSFENGVSVYEIDFRIDNVEHSFEIDAISGEIIDYIKE